jgi:heavy metal sensor kinase
MASYFSEFAERNKGGKDAEETIREMKEGRETAALFREGQLLYANNEDVIVGPDHKPVFTTDRKTNKRLVVLPFQVGGVEHRVAVFEPLDKLEGQIGRTRNIILFGLPAALLLAAAGGFLLVRKSLSPMVAISAQAEQISAKNLNERLKVTKRNDELGRLTGVFNELLSRLDSSFRVMREFMADASHELRTPLTIIQGESQVSLSHEHTASEYKQSLGVIRDQSKRMSNIVSDLLALARADAGEQNLRVEELYLNDLVEESCQVAQALAAPKSIRLNYETSEDILLQGNEELLSRMIVNLIDNAIRYTPTGGSVSVDLKCEQSAVRLTVSDTGIGIPPEHIGRVFDRFYRVDDSRARANGGSGLGLSIVKLAAESHHGTVNVYSEPGHGSTFTVSLPL